MIRTAFLLAALALTCPATAQVMTQDEVLQARILPGWRLENGHQLAALNLTLAPEWKTYWRSPGAAGIPPRFDWTGSQNVQTLRIHWPSPEVLWINDMISFGYHHKLVLPIEVTLADPTQDARLQLRVDLGICRDICMPARLDIVADLAAGGAVDPAILAAMDQRPVSGESAGLQGITCAVEPIADGLRVTATLTLPVQARVETVVIEPGDPTVWISEPQTRRSGATISGTTEMVGTTGAPFALDRSGIVVTVLGGARGIEVTGCPAP